MNKFLSILGVMAALAVTGWVFKELRMPVSGSTYEELFREADQSDGERFAPYLQRAMVDCNGWQGDESFRSHQSRDVTAQIGARVVSKMVDLRIESAAGRAADKTGIRTWLTSQFNARSRELDDVTGKEVLKRLSDVVVNTQCIMEHSVDAYRSA